jgi:hypothetical protein
MFHDVSNVNTKWLKTSIERKIKDIDTQNWLSDVNANSVCTNYKIFKCELGIDNYFQLNEYLRISLTHFRCRNHKLPISQNRYNDNIPNVCTLCNANEVGDEFHYIFKCTNFIDERKKYIKKYYYNRPNTLKFSELFNTSKLKELSNIAQFVKLIMSKFQ